MQYSEDTILKIRLYYACNFLYAQGKSHPQVVKILSEYVNDHDLIIAIADAAQFDKWRVVFNKVQQLVSEGLTYHEIRELVSSMKTDPQIVDFICNVWYEVKIFYVDNLLDSEDNIFVGLKWVIISSVILGILFLIGSSIFTKIFWSLVLFIAISTWIYGIKQRKLARQLNHILNYDFTKFGRLI
jgi:ABC-type multidrug transport system fused ATPase/permease subunit